MEKVDGKIDGKRKEERNLRRVEGGRGGEGEGGGGGGGRGKREEQEVREG